MNKIDFQNYNASLLNNFNAQTTYRLNNWLLRIYILNFHINHMS
jgi:hypothetical protein